MSRSRRREARSGSDATRRPLPAWAPDAAIAVALVVGYVALLLATTHNLGYARDEGFYFQAAASYEKWFDLLVHDRAAAMTRENVDRYWAVNHEHPALMKSLFALSHRILFERWHWFREAGTSYRFPGMVVSALALGIVFVWGRIALGRWPGLVGALTLGLMPRVFYHSHLDCFDMPVASMWLVTTFAYWLSVERRSLAWALITGVLYGLLLDTKHNAWLLPLALVAHAVVTGWPRLQRESRGGRVTVPAALISMAVIGPLVLYAAWPWIWFDTAERLAWWVKFHLGHEYYNMEFLGETYWKPPMPRLYAPVMTLATVPLVTLVLFGVGAGCAAWEAVRTRWWPDLPSPAPPTPLEPPALRRTVLLWALCLLLSYAPWLSSNTPIFGGTKHWITAYPFLCLFAALGFAVAADRLRVLAARWRHPFVSQGVPYALAAAVLIGPAKMTYDSHPWGLGFYAPLVGGAPGAATLGLNRSFWGYTTGAVVPYLNEHVPPGGTVYVHDTALQSWQMLVRDGRLRSDIRATLRPQDADVALYHHEPHMSRVEVQLWVLFGTVAPATIGTYEGVPIVWIYERPAVGRLGRRGATR